MLVLALLVGPAIAQSRQDERVQELVSNMTTNEKFSLLNGIGWSMVWILSDCHIALVQFGFLALATIFRFQKIPPLQFMISGIKRPKSISSLLSLAF